MEMFLNEQKEFMLDAYEKFSAMSDGETSLRENGKWSKKEILGHLIDSASNNHQRFVRAQFNDNLVFPGYDQNEWVNRQDYQDENWSVLVELWKSFNFHIAHLVKRIPEEILTQKRTKHNLDTIAWKEISADKPATLKYFIEDYYGHLRHHVNQILA